MMREDIIRMAREAGITSVVGDGRWGCLERFAALVAAKEGEACAKVCESLFDPDDDTCNEAEICAAAIRARGAKLKEKNHAA